MKKCDPHRTISEIVMERRGAVVIATVFLASLSACSPQSASSPQLPALSGNSTNRSADQRTKRRLVHPDYSVVYSFASTDTSQNPQGPLAIGPSGTLFGTTTAGNGTVYEYSGGSVTTLHAFTEAFPITGVVRGSDGTLYGTSRSGGNYCYTGCGTIFSLKLTGSAWKLKILHAFDTYGYGGDGLAPLGAPVLIGSALYGTTSEGGGGSPCYLGPVYDGCGTIYRVNTDGSGYTILYRFSSTGPDYPTGPLVTDGSGELYGTTKYTNFSCCGSVYKVSTLGLGFTDLHDFAGASSSDGAYPTSGVILDSTNLYGTTQGGGDTTCSYYGGCGVIFKVSLGMGFPESVLHQFNDAFGSSPVPSGLTLAPDGSLYGTQQYGGTCCGKVFKTTTGGTFTTVHNFLTGSSDGGGPRDTYSQSLSVDSSGTIWGATYNGGGCCGVIYHL